MQKITLIGFGRFGQTLYRLMKDDFDITIYSRKPLQLSFDTFASTTVLTQDLALAYQNQTIFYVVPISSFESVIKSHRKYFRDDHVLIDVLSVKVHPAQIFTKYLAKTSTQALLTHPMFGPDSTKTGFTNLPIVIDQFMAESATYNFWTEFFQQKKLQVIHMSAREHDRLAANSQGLAHFIGRLLEILKVEPTPIDTLGSQKLLEVKDQTCHDTWQLFRDLQQYNPYTKTMRLKLGAAYAKLYHQLLPKQLHPDVITYGIQGGPGSFNEEAILHYVKQAGIKDYKIKYLHTSKKVLAALERGEIDQGQFAISNSVGGMVDESIQAMAKHTFAIVTDYVIKISHTLMCRADATLTDIDTIMAHPQVFAQCAHTLAKKYPQLHQTAGEGDLIDHAVVAQYLGKHKLPKNIATMGSKILAELYGLSIIEENLQDAQANDTRFLLVKRS